MAFNRTIVPLSIQASDGNVNTPAFMVPDNSGKITAQFTYSGLSANATLSIQQSTDGTNFDPVLDISLAPVTLVLDKEKASATLNLVNLLTLWIRFSVDFAEAEAGSIHSVQYITT